jgi:hypothetical protein
MEKFTISTLAKTFDISRQTLLYYDKIGLLIVMSIFFCTFLLIFLCTILSYFLTFDNAVAVL